MLDTIPFTSVHSNLEHELAILTESFSPLRSVLHNLDLDMPEAHSNWFLPDQTSYSHQGRCNYKAPNAQWKFHCCLVMLLTDNLDADAMYQMPMMGSFHCYC